MRNVIAQLSKCAEYLEITLQLVDVTAWHRAVTKQVEQGIAFFGEVEGTDQQLDGRGVRAAHSRHYLLHENFMTGK
jgi:hypothetical protein